MKQTLIGCAILVVTFLLLSSCGPSPTYTLYVATTGNDSRPCTSESMPCLTLARALAQARELNTSLTEAGDGEPPNVTYIIHVAAGTYLVEAAAVGGPFAVVDFSVNILGAGIDATIFEAGGAYGGILIDGEASFLLRGFTIQNVTGGEIEGCIHIRGSVHGSIELVRVLRCLEAGIVNNSDLDAAEPIRLINVSVLESVALREYREAIRGEAGHGIVNAGAMDIRNSTIRLNEGVGVFSSRSLSMSEGVVELNGKSGLLLSGEALLENVSIRSNGSDGCVIVSTNEWCVRGSSAGIEIVDGAQVQVYGGSITRNLYGAYVDAPGTLLTLVGVRVGANDLAGVYVLDGALSVLESEIIGNARRYLAGDLGAQHAIYVGAEAEANITDSRVDGNQNGGIDNHGNLSVLNSSISENLGVQRALLNSGTATLENTLVGSNQMVRVLPDGSVRAEGVSQWSAGAVVNLSGSTLQLVNTTVSENLGYGILNQGSMTLSYSTVAYNETSGLVLQLNDSAPSTIVGNSLIAGHGIPDWDCLLQRGDSLLAPISSGFNIDTDASCHFGNTFTLVELMVDELADNGGFTMTNALLEGSPAIDAALGDCPLSDQRLIRRPFGSACDVGAYETSAFTALSGAVDTPTPDVPFLIVLQDSGCFYGPGLDWPRYSNLSAGTQAEIVGQGFGGGWMVIKHPTITNTNCWIDIDDVEFDIPLDELRLISVPAKPTQPTPTREDREPTACPTSQQTPGQCQ